MNKLLVGAVGAVVLLGAGGWWYVSSHDNDSTASGSNQTNKSIGKKVAKTVEQIVQDGSSWRCTYEQEADSGTMYFSNKRVRVDTTRVENGSSRQGSMIIKDEAQYVWYEDTEKGLKFSLAGDSSSGSANGGVSTTDNYDFTCYDWDVEEDKFTPPSNIEFTDLSTLLPPTIPTTE